MNYRLFFVGLFLILSVQLVTAANPADRRKDAVEADSVKNSVNYLKYFLGRQGSWYPQNPELERSLRSLVHFVEDEKIDSTLHKLKQFGDANQFYFYRSPNHVADSLSISGYMPHAELSERLKRIDRSVRTSIVKEQIPVPEQLLQNLDRKVKLLQKEDVDWLLRSNKVKMPDSLTMYNVIPDSLMSSPADFRRIQRMDSTKREILEKARLEYNNRAVANYVDSVSNVYRDEYIREYSQKVQRDFADSIRTQNRNRLIHYNDSVIAAVNDSIKGILRILTSYANNDSTLVWVKNSDRDSTQIWLRNNDRYFTRLFIKNEQNDSLSVRVENTGKNSMRLLIDDAVTFHRLAERQKKEFQFSGFQMDSRLRAVEKRYQVITPWVLRGDGTMGFTQTHLSDTWKKGGQSSFAFLMVLKGNANYSYKKIKWENSAEIRNGWMKPADEKIRKNDDKFQVTSRFGVSAFKKWYYSSEVDFETQLFNGYKYPDRETLISGFLSPAKTLIKVGLDYKPNNNFSLFISPLTSKTVFVRDSARVDVTRYGIEAGRRSYWEPGLNTDLKYKHNITPDITYELKYKMFVNYSNPSNFDVDWENNLAMRLNNYINMQVLFHFIYDYKVKFPTNKLDSEGNTINKAKWQFKEFITIGFNYKLNKPIYKRKEV